MGFNTTRRRSRFSNYNFLADGLASTLGVPAAPLGYSLARNNVSADIARKIAFRHRRVKELYNMYRNNVAGEETCPGGVDGGRGAVKRREGRGTAEVGVEE